MAFCTLITSFSQIMKCCPLEHSYQFFLVVVAADLVLEALNRCSSPPLEASQVQELFLQLSIDLNDITVIFVINL